MSAPVSLRSLTARTVHIKMRPTAWSFDDRREVLRVLERFGEVTMFRSLKYHPRVAIHNAFLSLFTTEDAAKAAVAASPIRYSLINSSADKSLPGANTSIPNELIESPQRKPTQPDEEGRVYELNVSVTNFDHGRYLESSQTNPLHGPYEPISSRSSALRSILASEMPMTAWSPGLQDWDSDPIRFRSALEQSPAIDETRDELKGRDDNSQHGEGGSNKVQISASRAFAEREQRRRLRSISRVMRGLSVLSKEANEEGTPRS